MRACRSKTASLSWPRCAKRACRLSCICMNVGRMDLHWVGKIRFFRPGPIAWPTGFGYGGSHVKATVHEYQNTAELLVSCFRKTMNKYRFKDRCTIHEIT